MKDIQSDHLTLRVSGRELGRDRLVDLPQSFAVIGRSSQADISLQSSRVSFRHAYLQVLDRRVLCVDLESKTGISWGNQRRSCGWLSVKESVRIGPYRLSLAHDPFGERESSANDPISNPLTEQVQAGLFPKWRLELFDDSIADPMLPIEHRISLVGRDAHCTVRLEDLSVSRVHCALVLSEDGLWVVDLLGKGGIRLDGQLVQIERAQSGSELLVGKQAMTLWRCDSEFRQALPKDLAESSAGNVEPTDGLDSLEQWMGTLFAVESHRAALVIMPTMHTGMFRYAKLQLELNALRFKLQRMDTTNLILDLRGLVCPGAEVICALVSLARQTEARGGQVAICSPTAESETALKRMGLARIWRIYPTREAALAAMHAA